MTSGNYRIICKLCGGSSEAFIDYDQKLYHQHLGNMPRIEWGTLGSVISGRYRLDKEMGWQCTCGNDTLLTSQEKQLTNKAQPDPQEIDDIKKKLIADAVTTFTLELV